MKQVINFSAFCDSFRDSRPDNFSYDGLRALHDYLTALEDDLGEEIELDVIALCCDYTEYGSVAEFNENYYKEYKNLDDVARDTTVIDLETGGFIIQNF